MILFENLDEVVSFAVKVLFQVSVIALIGLAAQQWTKRRYALSHTVGLITLTAVVLSPLIAYPLQRSQYAWIRVPIFSSQDHNPSDSNTPSAQPSWPAHETALDSSDAFDETSLAAQTEFSSNALSTEREEPQEVLDSPRIDSEIAIAPLPSAGSIPQANGFDLNGSSVGVAFLAIWWIGIPVLLARRLIRYSRLWRLMQHAVPLNDAAANHLCLELARKLQLQKSPRMLVTDQMPVPFVIGLLSPAIVLPRDLLHESSRAELQHVLLHELGHLKRFDLWASLLQRCVELVYWINPLVRWVSQRTTRSREEICDNYVLKSVSPVQYAKTLLALTEKLQNAHPIAASSMGVIGQNWSLESRVRGLLSHNRNMDTQVSRTKSSLIMTAAGGLLVVVGGISFQSISTNAAFNVVASSQDDDKSSGAVSDAKAVLEKTLNRAEWWARTKPANLKSLSYSYKLKYQTQKVEGVEPATYSQWHGTTLHSCMQVLATSQDKFDIETQLLDDRDGQRRVLLKCKRRDKQPPIAIAIGNGVSDRWAGYFSLSVDEFSVEIDAEKWLPIKEQIDSTTISYNKWIDAQDGLHSLPREISIEHEGTQWNSSFGWHNELAWLLNRTETTVDGVPIVIASTSEISVNPEIKKKTPSADYDSRRQRSSASIAAMLERNKLWLQPKLFGLKSLEYTFHNLREDIKEACYIDQDGTAIFEVVHDGQDKGKSLGHRKMALPTGEWANTTSTHTFLNLHQPNPKSPFFARKLSNYARMGCQLDLPIFGLENSLKTSGLLYADEINWNGIPCDAVQTVPVPGAVLELGSGTMLAFSSWSYMRPFRPASEYLIIEKERHIPLYERIRDGRDRTFEIQYSDWVHLQEDQWAPLAIRIICKDEFQCEYGFQIINNQHWLLKDVTSWFDEKDKSRAIVGDIVVNKTSAMHDSALKQLDASRKLFSEKASTNSTEVQLNTGNLVFGQWVQVGKARSILTLKNQSTAEVRVESIEPNLSSNPLPVLLIESTGRVADCIQVPMKFTDGKWVGNATVASERDCINFTAIAIGTEKGNNTRTIQAFPISLQDVVETNVTSPENNKNRIASVQLVHDANQALVAKIKVVSIHGPMEFPMHVNIALFNKAGSLIAGGRTSETFRVESNPVEKELAISLGEHLDPNQVAAIALSIENGAVTSAPMGSKWGMFMHDPEINVPLESLFKATDPQCHEIAVERLTKKIYRETIQEEWFEQPFKRERLITRHAASQHILEPYVMWLKKLYLESDKRSLRSATALLLGHAGDTTAAEQLLPSAESNEQAAVALAMLGNEAGMQIVERVIARDKNDDLETDALIGLLKLNTEASIELLGKTLMQDLKEMTASVGEKGTREAIGRDDRALRITRLLAYADERSVPWVLEATEFLDSNPDIAEVFDRSGLSAAMMKHGAAPKEKIVRMLREQNVYWIGTMRDNRDPYFMDAILELLQDPKTDAWAYEQGVRYLWNLQSPKAIESLQELIRKPEPTDAIARLALCEALCYFDKDEGLRECHRLLAAELRRGADLDAKEERKLQKKINAVLGRSSVEMLQRVATEQLGATDASDRRATLMLLERVRDLEPAIESGLKVWLESDDVTVREATQKTLELHGVLVK